MMTTPVEKLDQLNHQIRFLETLQKLNDLLSEIRERIDGTKDLETWLGEEGTGIMINNLKGLLFSLQSEMIAIPKFIAKLDAGISAAGQITAGVDAITRMVRAIETAETSTGEQKVKDFAELFSDWTTLLGAIGYILEGFSVNPIIGVYFMILGKAISAIAVSMGQIEAATKATNAAIRVARGFDPDVDTSAEEATAEQQRQLQALIDDLKRQREALIAEFGLEHHAKIDAAIDATLAELGLTMIEVDRLKDALATARQNLTQAWEQLQVLITERDFVTATGGSAHEAEALERRIKAAEEALADAYHEYNNCLEPVKRYDRSLRRRIKALQRRGDAAFEDTLDDRGLTDEHIPYLHFPQLYDIRKYLNENVWKASRSAILSRVGLTGLVGLLPAGTCYLVAAVLGGLAMMSVCVVAGYYMMTQGLFGLGRPQDEIAVQPDVPVANEEVVVQAPEAEPPPPAVPTLSPRVVYDIIAQFGDMYHLSEAEMDELANSYWEDPTGRQLYSIMTTIAMLDVLQARIDGWFAQPFDFSGIWLDTMLNFTKYPCNSEADGVLTVCAETAGNIEAGEVLVFGMELEGDIPLADPALFYVYSVVLDSDGDPDNNFQFMPPYDWDFYQNTDLWYELMWDPNHGAWTLSRRDVRQGMEIVQHTDARAMINGNLIYFLIPGDEVDVPRPGYRMTAFAHDGTYAPEASGGDVTGVDPTEPLLQMPEEAIVVE